MTRPAGWPANIAKLATLLRNEASGQRQGWTPGSGLSLRVTTSILSLNDANLGPRVEPVGRTVSRKSLSAIN
jgi:hypothetical protein